MWIPTGSTLLNLAISQDPYKAFKAGRVHRITGESSTTKTGLAASAFFLGALFCDRAQQPFKFVYDDVEQTFDVDYYRKAYPFIDKFLDNSLILKTDDDSSKCLEDFTKSFIDLCRECEEENKIGFYFVDSLDSLPPKDELKRFDKEGISVSINPALKASLLSQFFQDSTIKMSKARVGLVLVSQVRDVMAMGGVSNRGGAAKRISGGNAPTFYSSVIIYLKKRSDDILELFDSAKNKGVGVKVTESINIEFKVTKNKLGRPFLSGFFTFVVSTGVIDDVRDLIEFLVQTEYFIYNRGWFTIDGKKYRFKEVEEMVKANIKEYREIASNIFNDSLAKSKQLTDIQTLW